MLCHPEAIMSGPRNAPAPIDRDVDFDVIVIGGGPAGATAASWPARAGRRVVVLERERFPRFHIGESLLASVNNVLGQIGADALIREAGFTPKWGATFMSGDGRIERDADFSIAPGVPTPQTWQVPRATFDQLLLDHAAASGADVRQGHRVLEIDIDDTGVSATVHAPESDTARYSIGAQAVIDASGRGSVLARKFDLRVDEPRLANISVLSHYAGCPVNRVAGPETSASSPAAISAGSGSFRFRPT
jgi:FADH2-dependent halogenase